MEYIILAVLFAAVSLWLGMFLNAIATPVVVASTWKPAWRRPSKRFSRKLYTRVETPSLGLARRARRALQFTPSERKARARAFHEGRLIAKAAEAAEAETVAVNVIPISRGVEIRGRHKSRAVRNQAAKALKAKVASLPAAPKKKSVLWLTEDMVIETPRKGRAPRRFYQSSDAERARIFELFSMGKLHGATPICAACQGEGCESCDDSGLVQKVAAVAACLILFILFPDAIEGIGMLAVGSMNVVGKKGSTMNIVMRDLWREWLQMAKTVEKQCTEDSAKAELPNHIAAIHNLGGHVVKGESEIMDSNLDIHRARVREARNGFAPLPKAEELPSAGRRELPTSTTPEIGLGNVEYNRPEKGMDFYYLHVDGDKAVARSKTVTMKETPVALAEQVIQSLEDIDKQWKKEEKLMKAIKRAHQQLIKHDVHTEVGLFRAQQWASAIEIMESELNSMDFHLRALRDANYCTYGPIYKDGKVVNHPVYINGRKVWTPIVGTHAKYACNSQNATGSRWEDTGYARWDSDEHKLIPIKQLVRFPVVVTAGRSNVGEAELGTELDYEPVKEPNHGQQDKIIHEAGKNTCELPDWGSTDFSVVDEPRGDRKYTYNPDAEEEHLDFVLETLDSVKKAGELIELYNHVQQLYKAKAVRWHIFKEMHTPIVEQGERRIEAGSILFRMAHTKVIKEMEPKQKKLIALARKQYKIIDGWSYLDAKDAECPTHLNRERAELRKAKNLRAKSNPTAIRTASGRLRGEALEHNRKAVRAYYATEKRNARSMKWAWENFLKREGLGEGKNGQPFGDIHDGVEDALAIKEARGGDMETMMEMPEDNERSLISELMDIGGVGEATILKLEDAGFRTADQINQASYEQLCEAIGNRRRAFLVWWGGAAILAEKTSDIEELRHMAVAMFGKTRGLSVDLLKPFYREAANEQVDIIRKDLTHNPFLSLADVEEGMPSLKVRSMNTEKDHLPAQGYTGYTIFTPDEDTVARVYVSEDQ